MSAASECLGCSYCGVLKQEAKGLREHILELTKLLDSLWDIKTAESVATQTEVQCNTYTTEVQVTAESELTSPSITSPCLGSVFNQSESVCSDSTSNWTADQDTLSMLSIDEELNELVEPFSIYPVRKEFAHFDLDMLDRSTTFTHMFNNRNVAYYGALSYSYGDVTHFPKPFSSNPYLVEVLELVQIIFPNYFFNSAMITEYKNGSFFMPYHSDNEDEISDDSDILTISLGQSRQLNFRAKSNNIFDSSNVKSITLSHGDVISMSKLSQSYFEHSLPKDYSKSARISITLRNIAPQYISTPEYESVLNNLGSSQCNNVADHGLSPCNGDSTTSFGDRGPPPLTVEGYQALDQSSSYPGYQKQSSATIHEPQHSHVSTVLVSSSMFRLLDDSKLSSKSQTAKVLFYPGATAGEMLKRLREDPDFKKINPLFVKKIYLLTGTNNVDRILIVPRSLQNSIIDNKFTIDNYQFNNATADISKLTFFLHEWAKSATVNLINILPRESWVRNRVINDLNDFLNTLSRKCPYINKIDTELNRNLFSTSNGYRKSMYFNSNGEDNVHLNYLGIERLGKHLKFLLHN